MPALDLTCPNCGAPLHGGECAVDGCGYKAPKADGCMQHGKEELDSKVCDSCGKKDGCAKKPKTKADGSSRVDRVDYWGPLNEAAKESAPMKTLASGAIQGRAAITCVGVFRYLNADGSVRNEFRPPEEVFKKESLESFKMAPVTNTHPKDKVTPDNFQGVAVGSLGGDISHDAYNVYAELTIQDAKAIADAKAGRTGLSGGYSCDMVESGKVSYPVLGWAEDPIDKQYKEMQVGSTDYPVPGVWGGIPYDMIQTNIVGNHVALVDVPRGGDALHLRFDSADLQEIGIRIPSTQEAPANKADGTTPQLRTGGAPMKTIHLDGAVKFDVPEPVADRIDSLDAKILALEADKSTLKAKADSAQDELAAEKQARKDSEDGFQATLDAAVANRLALVETATTHGVEVKADSKDDEIRHALILKAFPAAKLDGEDSAYIKARFDSAIDVLAAAKVKADEAAPNLQRQNAADGVPASTHQDGASPDWRSGWSNAHKRTVQ